MIHEQCELLSELLNKSYSAKSAINNYCGCTNYWTESKHLSIDIITKMPNLHNANYIKSLINKRIKSFNKKHSGYSIAQIIVDRITYLTANKLRVIVTMVGIFRVQYEQGCIDDLNEYQLEHKNKDPFTYKYFSRLCCENGKRSDYQPPDGCTNKGVMVATKDGWVCPCGKYPLT